MFLEILLAVIIGILAGTFTGLFPGIHVNLVAITIVASAPLLLQYFGLIQLISFLVSMAITHTFLDTIPAIFLGIPEESTALSVLPGHELVLKGRGYEAVRLTVIGSFFGIFIILIISPLYLFILPKYYPFLQNYMAHILIVVSSFLILRDKKKLLAFSMFILSGVLGIFALSLTVIKQPLFPLLSGLFGSSLIIISFIKNVKIPKQNFKIKTKVNGTFSALLASIISGSLVSFLPGLGAAQGAVIGSSFTKLNKKAFLILLGTISTVTMGLGFTALYAISRPRHGVAVAIGELLEFSQIPHFILILTIMIFVGGIAVFLSLMFAKIFAKNIYKFNYRKLSSIILLLIFILSIIISGWYSLIILVTGTAIGIVASILGVRKMHLMGCLILPIIFFFLL